jgi:alpha-ketoglutarate-dependent taurine dioxygenase
MAILVARDKHVMNLNVEEILRGIPTPSSLPVPNSEVNDLLNREILNYASYFGKPYGFDKEQGGALVQDLFPIRKNETEQISSSSKVELEMHTETAFHPKAPRFVVLFCLRGDPAAGTTICDLSQVIGELNQDEIQILSKRSFMTSVDKSFLDEGEEDKEVRRQVINKRGTKMKYDRTAMRGTTPEAQKALDKFTTLIQKNKSTIYLETGEILIIDNWTTAHGRTQFTSRYDGTDRWIKRVMVSNEKPFGRIIWYPNEWYYLFPWLSSDG